MTGRIPVTALGVGAFLGMVASYAVGWWLGWIEFIAIAAGFCVALILALPFVVGGQPLEVTRDVEPKRVPVGGRASSVLNIANRGRSTSAPRVVEDRIAGLSRSLDIPALAVGASTQAIATLPTNKRAVVEVGPALITRADPLGLFRRDLGQTGKTLLWVHPRVALLPAMRSGFVKDLEGPTYDTSPAGDVAFHAIREYQHGDDVRHIHWMSTARTGTLMVRHFVDNRRPYLGILVDSHPDAMSPTAFEGALEAAASHVVSADHEGRPLAVWVGSQQIVTSTSPADVTSALDRFCRSEQHDAGVSLVDQYELLRLTDQSVSAFVYVTGPTSAGDLLEVVSAARKHGPAIVVRFVEADTAPVMLPNARVIDCLDLDQFVTAWMGLAR